MYNIFAFLLCVQKINQHFVNYIWVEHVFEELTALFVMFVGREQSFANTGWGTYVKREMIVNFYMNMIWLKCQCVTFSKSLANVTTGIANICMWMQIPWRSMTVHGMIVGFVSMVSCSNTRMIIYYLSPTGPNCRNRHTRRVLCQNYLCGFCPHGVKCNFVQ